MIRQAKEGQVTWMPGVVASDIPHPLPKGITVHIRGYDTGIEIQGLVGTIPLLNGDTLQIVPKIDRINFLRLLFKAEGLQTNLEREFDDFVEYSIDDEKSIDSLVARHLLVVVSEILRRSPMQGRVKRWRRGTFAVGQVDAMATALNLACHRNEPVVYRSSERSPSIPENRVITEALIRGWQLMDSGVETELLWICDRWLRRFPRSEDLEEDLEHVEQGFASVRYGGPRDYYRKALMLSQILLGSQGLGLGVASDVTGDAVLLNTAAIYEKYLRNVIASKYAKSGYVVGKGGVSSRSLYTDGSYKLQPDIVVSKDGRVLLIGDAKYKEPTAGDHYQMHAYLVGNDLSRGVLFAPLFAGDQIVVREFATERRLVIREVYLPLSNLTVTEEFLGEVVERFA